VEGSWGQTLTIKFRKIDAINVNSPWENDVTLGQTHWGQTLYLILSRVGLLQIDF